MTYSADIRNLVLKKLSEGSTIRGLAKAFQISPQTIGKALKRIGITQKKESKTSKGR